MNARIFLVVIASIFFIFFSCRAKKHGAPAAVNTINAQAADSVMNALDAVQIRVQAPDTITTASGFRFVLLRHYGGSRKAQFGDNLEVRYHGMLTDGSEFDNSYKYGKNFVFSLGNKNIMRGWNEGFAMMSEGDSALFIIPPALGYGSAGAKGIPPNSTLLYYVELVTIKDPPHVSPYLWKGRPEHVTESGLKYYVVKEGSGTRAYPMASVKIHYTGFLSDGKVFDSSILREEPQEFKLGVGMVIKGLDEAVLLMRVGARYHLVIPPGLAYGDQEAGGGAIPPNATLEYDVELIDVK
jgi:peptidylprolyl isomerase